MAEVSPLSKVNDYNLTRLGRAIGPRVESHPDFSGVHPLTESLEAFAARYLLIEMAEQRLDIQYYIWQNDLSGRLMFSALLDAAERGVAVRLLLDDNNTLGMDDILRELNTHPLIEVRLFNAFSFRSLRALGYLTDFARLNRRMHNKSFTVDGVATIVGGRNVGDAYFGAGPDPVFSDLDVLAIGPVVAEVGNDFLRYWNSRAVQSLKQVLGDKKGSICRQVEFPRDWRESSKARRYLYRLQHSSFRHLLERGELNFIWAKTRLLSDDPRKGLGRAKTSTLLPQRLIEVIGKPQQQFDIISAYFVPTRSGVAQLLSLVRSGVKVAVLTNSLAANDVSVVHAGYARWRKKLLRYGVALYELKPVSDRRTPHDRGITGNSGSSLHAKTFSVDMRKVFIGSFNFDPRSAMLNTEMGLLIESERLASDIHHRFHDSMGDKTWMLRLDKWGRVNWVEYPGKGEKERVHKHEPQTRFSQRLLVRLVWHLPIEWLL